MKTIDLFATIGWMTSLCLLIGAVLVLAMLAIGIW